MNRRLILKAAVGACAALLLPWRKAKAGPSWARLVNFVPGEYQYSCPDGTFDQTLRIKRLIERWPENKPTGKLADFETTTYEMGVIRHFETPTTRILLENNDNLAGLVQIEDSVTASMSDSELSEQLAQAFLWSLHKKEVVCIREKGGVSGEYTIFGNMDKLGGLSKT